MALSIAIVQWKQETYIVVGSWESKEDAQKWLDSGEVVLALEKFEGEPHDPNQKVLEVMMVNATHDHCIGQSLERLLRFVFDLGRKFER